MSDKTPIDTALELLVYAPLGLAITLTEEMPSLVEKGRQRLTMARMMGQMAAPQLQSEAEKAIKSVAARVTAPPRPAAAPTPPPAPAAETAPAPAPQPEEPPRSQAAPELSAELAIPGYDTLSAMQVVQRLNGLDPKELGQVRSYEAAHRGRKTILGRADQLLAEA
ncbi:MAG TPA: hypothetical protein VFP54_09630 [Acidimicrobiales bacterium]|nr:hypothetical protein [Acidimicrobiales bacterium]